MSGLWKMFRWLRGRQLSPIVVIVGVCALCAAEVFTVVVLFCAAETLGVWFLPLLLCCFAALIAVLGLLLRSHSVRQMAAMMDVTPQEIERRLREERRGKRMFHGRTGNS